MRREPTAHRPETWRHAAWECFWFLVCVALFIAITAVSQ